MADSIVAKRLVRNLRYRLTYIKIFESFLQPEPHPEVIRLLHALIDAQRSAVKSLTAYLQNLGVAAHDLPLVRRLQEHASSRVNIRSRLRFAHYGLTKAVSWYQEQLMDAQMIADAELRSLLFELGELEAASLWRTSAAMALLGIPERAESQTVAKIPHRESARRGRGRTHPEGTKNSTRASSGRSGSSRRPARARAEGGR